MSESSPSISIIIPVYNGGNFLPLCLDGINSSTFKSFEVVIVDDCSTDGSGEIGRESGALVLSTGERSGPGAARNLAAKTANGDILMFVDADVVVAPNTLQLVAERFESDPGLSALFGSYDDKPAAANFLSQYKNLQHHFVHQNSSSEAFTFWSGLGAIRREIFLAHGGFDCKKFAVPSIEDIELGFRLRKAGHRILLDRDIQATHLKRWEIIAHLRTEIFCRALPWSRLIIENKEMTNDMNLKSSDRLSAVLVALSLLMLPFVVWKPIAGVVLIGFLLALVFLNRDILKFYAQKRGLLFAAMTLPWQILYFFYSGTVFVLCWLRYMVSQTLGYQADQPSHPQNDAR